MSIMFCKQCERHVDTDFDVEGTVTENDEYICGSCTESNGLMKDNPRSEDSPGVTMMQDFGKMLLGGTS